jgi:hypothetical protein
MEALVNDEELAEQLLDRDDDEPTPTVRMSEYSPELERLTDLMDRLGELIAVVAAANGVKKPKLPRPAPRPATASQRLRKRRREDKHRALVARVLPHRVNS